ncbi:MAG: TetR/AcrR family transcriptional regulator C-terminal domain-containing protein [Solirubrobacteraceae bacterium]
MSAEPARRRPGPAPRFTREHVLETALELIDAGEPESFSMRRLADVLGVTPMSLYAYVKNKDELIEGATLIALAAAHDEPGAGAPWQEQIRAVVREIHIVLRRHPNLATLVIGHRTRASGLFRIRERMLQTLLDAGFEQTTALHSLGVLSYYALGFASGQAALAGVDPAQSLPDLPPEDFPRLTELARQYGEHASDQAFEFGLEQLLEGLERIRNGR